MNGIWTDSVPITYGGNGRGGSIVFPFMFPGDTGPSNYPAWYDAYPRGDRNLAFGLESRPLNIGELFTIELAYAWARDTSNIASREKLRRSVDTLITAHENFFNNFSTGIEKNQKRILNIYPNPSSDFIYLNGLNEQTEIVIYSSNGGIVLQDITSLHKPINISSLAHGIYIIRAGNYTGKFVKQ